MNSLPAKSNRRPGVEDTAKIREVFKNFDVNGDGIISREEFSEMLDKMGINMAKSLEDEFFAQMDDDESGELEFGEFLDWYTTLIDLADAEAQRKLAQLQKTTTFTKTELEAIYDNYKRVSASVTDDGTIDQEEFRQMMMSGGVNKNDSFLVDGLFRMFDSDGSGNISFEEFVHILSIYHNKNNKSKEEKHKLFFGLYDVDKDNKISEGDLSKILADCMSCNNMHLKESDIQKLVQATFKRNGCGSGGMDYNAYVKEMEERRLA